MSETAKIPFERPRHNHQQCISQALAIAETLCEERGLRLTPVRRRVLELVWQEHEPIGAYELLAALARDGSSPAPPTVYRALEFLCGAGLVHRIDSLNAYIGCDRADEAHVGQFLVCHQCQRVAEIDNPVLKRSLARAAREAGFSLDAAVEIKGQCARCQSTA